MHLCNRKLQFRSPCTNTYYTGKHDSSSLTGKMDASLSQQHIRSYTACELKFQNRKTTTKPTNI